MTNIALAIGVMLWMSPMSQSFPSIQHNQATIVNSGSTNTSGFRIAVKRSGAAEYATVPRGANAQNVEPEKEGREIPSNLASRLFADLEAAKPLASLPAPHCMKSKSFGTRLTIEFGGETTPDLSCGDGGNEHLRELIKDANEAVAFFRTK
jgi:hypothetical protein